MAASAALPFSLDEFRARKDRVRGAMVERRLDAQIVTTPENIYYLCGYSTPAYYSTQALILPLLSEPLLFTYVADQGTAQGAADVTTTVTYGPGGNPMLKLAAVLHDHGLTSRRVGLELGSWFFSVAAYRQLTQALGGSELGDGSGIVERCRVVKSAAEIGYLRAGVKTASASMQAVLEAIAPGMSENDLAAAAYTAALQAGSEFPSSPPYVASGPRVCIPQPHGRADRSSMTTRFLSRCAAACAAAAAP